MKFPRVPEKQVQKDVIKNAERFGCEVVRFSQPFGSLQTPGIPDLRIRHLDRNKVAWFEVKAKDGVQSKDQKAFQKSEEAVGARYVLGGVPALLSLLREWGFRLATLGEGSE